MWLSFCWSFQAWPKCPGPYDGSMARNKEPKAYWQEVDDYSYLLYSLSSSQYPGTSWKWLGFHSQWLRLSSLMILRSRWWMDSPFIICVWCALHQLHRCKVRHCLELDVRFYFLLPTLPWQILLLCMGAMNNTSFQRWPSPVKTESLAEPSNQFLAFATPRNPWFSVCRCR